jgi:hypothetical protein
LERIAQSIILLRGYKVLLDADLAALYDVPTKVLLQAVKRNPERFPEDFMLQLTATEWANLRSQIVTSSVQHAGATGRKMRPVLMLQNAISNEVTASRRMGGV